MANYLDYIKEKKEVILALNEHTETSTLSQIYKNLKVPTKVLSVGGYSCQKIAKEYWDKAITRADVRKFFNDDLYEGFVAAMMWGGLGSDGRSFSHLEKAMAKSKQPEVTSKLKNVQEYLVNGKISEAFASMCPGGTNKIEGVDVSYFTKILFFMSDISDYTKAIPLIYDNWGWHIHAAMLLSSGQEDKICDLFAIQAFLKKGKGHYTIHPRVILPDSSTSRRVKAYMDYIQLMHERSLELSPTLCPGNLEQFLFGKSRKDADAKSPNNPRVHLVNYLTEELGKLFKEANVSMTTDDVEDSELEAPCLAKSGKIPGRSNAIPEKYFSFYFDGEPIYVFTFRQKNDQACEVWNKHGHYPCVPELINLGLSEEGKSICYIKRFSLDDTQGTEQLYNALKELFNQ